MVNLVASLLSRPHGGGESGLAGVILGGVVLVIVLGAVFFWLLVLAFLASRIFSKAKKPAIAAFIPIWNAIVALEMVGKPAWWVLLFLIPGLNVLLFIYLKALLLETFGVEAPTSYVLAIAGAFIPPVDLVLLVWGAFGDVRYTAPTAYAASPAY